MKMLVINAGSSSIKFTVFNFSWIGKQQVLASGQVECIGLPVSNLIYKKDNCGKTTTEIKPKNGEQTITHIEAMKAICDKLLDKEDGVLANISEVIAIGHRTVHGGEEITKPVIINEHVKNVMKKCFDLAPLHNPPNLMGIEACEKIFPNIPNVAIFDTAFHQTMPPESYLYALPYELYKKYGIRRYGFHGTSHHYVARATANFLKVNFEELKLITCHLGNGCSMAAINKGNVVDTSMGMTPLEGLVMGTRCGDIDPAIPLSLIDKGMHPKEVDKLLNKKSGLFGVAGINSGDMRDIIQAAEKGNEQAELALKIYIHRIIKYIGAYIAILNEVNAVVFTGGVGENSAYIREKVLSNLTSLGITFDAERNKAAIGQAATISAKGSKIKAIVMPTNEELMIAEQSIHLLLEEGKLKLVAIN